MLLINVQNCFYSHGNLDCPAKFSTAIMLYCFGTCGDDWLDNQDGCQQPDADAYCKLKLCDGNAIASSFDITTSTNNPGFACDGVGTNYGHWFGIPHVYFDDDIRTTHGAADVVSNVMCQIPGKYNYYFRAIYTSIVVSSSLLMLTYFS